MASKEKVRETMKKWAAEKYRVAKIHECKCVVCDTLFVHKVKTTKTCSVQCLKKMSSKNGIKAGRLSTVSFLNRRCRSKIEIQFAELLKQYFPDILTNKRIFFEYDADIIIPSLKLAIHWNGPLHYKPIYGDEYLKKIQDKDVKRYEAVKRTGYTNYIVNDSESKAKRKYIDTKINNEIDNLFLFLSFLSSEL